MNAQIGAYPEYKNSGVAWLGEIPAHWEVRRFGSMSQSQNLRGEPALPLLSVLREKGVVLRSELSEGENNNLLPEDLSNYKVVFSGQLAINKMKAWQGSLGISKHDGVVSPAYYVYALTGISTGFAHRLLRSRPYIALFAQYSDGVRIGQWDLSPDRLKQLPILIPPLDEQAAIVKYLAHVDRKIDRFIRSKRRMIELLNEQKQAIIHQAVTKGLDPSVPMKDSGVEWLGEIPAHWEPRRLKSLVGILEQGWSPQCESFPAGIDEWGVLKVGCVNRDAFDSSQNKRLPDDLNPVPHLEVTSGDILVSRANTKDLVGLAALVEMAPSKLLLSDKLFRFRPHEAIVDPYFLVLAIRDRCSRNQIEASTNGASDSMQNIGQSVIRNLWVAVAGIQEQRDIVLYLNEQTSSLTSTIQSAEREIDLIREYRTRLISDVVTGKIDVRAAAATLPEIEDVALPTGWDSEFAANGHEDAGELEEDE